MSARLLHAAVIASVMLALVGGCAYRGAPQLPDLATVYVLNVVEPRAHTRHAIHVDGRVVAVLSPGQYTRFTIAPGHYDFTVTGSGGRTRDQDAVGYQFLPGQRRYLVYDDSLREGYLIEYGPDYAGRWMESAQRVQPIRNRLSAH